MKEFKDASIEMVQDIFYHIPNYDYGGVIDVSYIRLSESNFMSSTSGRFLRGPLVFREISFVNGEFPSEFTLILERKIYYRAPVFQQSILLRPSLFLPEQMGVYFWLKYEPSIPITSLPRIYIDVEIPRPIA